MCIWYTFNVFFVEIYEREELFKISVRKLINLFVCMLYECDKLICQWKFKSKFGILWFSLNRTNFYVRKSFKKPKMFFWSKFYIKLKAEPDDGIFFLFVIKYIVFCSVLYNNILKLKIIRTKIICNFCWYINFM